MHLVFQSEVKSDMFHSFFSEGLCLCFIFLFLNVLDHVWEPHSQAVIAAKLWESRQIKQTSEALWNNNITLQVMWLFNLPERHGEPNSHEHEGCPFIFRVEAGKDVTPHLQHVNKKTQPLIKKALETSSQLSVNVWLMRQWFSHTCCWRNISKQEHATRKARMKLKDRR